MRNLKIAKMSEVIARSSFKYQEQKDTLTPSQLKAALIGLLFLSFEFASGSSCPIDCSQSPIFPWDFRDSNALIELPPSLFVRASATWGECLNY